MCATERRGENRRTLVARRKNGQWFALVSPLSGCAAFVVLRPLTFSVSAFFLASSSLTCTQMKQRGSKHKRVGKDGGRKIKEGGEAREELAA